MVVGEAPEPTGDGVVLDVVAASICGTDLHFLREAGQGFVMGHEFAGTVDGVPYAVEPTVFCGSCEQCRSGSTQRCTNDRINIGISRDGGLADRVLVPEYGLIPLPDGLAVEDASLVEPASVSWHGARRAEIQPGERVAVVGGGTIGLLAGAAVLHLGHDHVALEARHPHQREAGERLGLVAPTGEYDVVIDAAGTESALARCGELVRPGGRVVLLGVSTGALAVPGVATLVKEITWVGSMGRCRHDGIRESDEAAALLAARPEIAQTLDHPPVPARRRRRGLPRRRRQDQRGPQGRARPVIADLTGRTAVVTGAASGIGLAIAERCAERRMRVLLADIDGEGAEREAERLRAHGADARAARVDVTDPDDVDRLAATAADSLRAVHLLVNNAGIVAMGPVLGDPARRVAPGRRRRPVGRGPRHPVVRPRDARRRRARPRRDHRLDGVRAAPRRPVALRRQQARRARTRRRAAGRAPRRRRRPRRHRRDARPYPHRHEPARVRRRRSSPTSSRTPSATTCPTPSTIPIGALRWPGRFEAILRGFDPR